MECTDEDSEEEMIFKVRLLEFLEELKNEYGKVA